MKLALIGLAAGLLLGGITGFSIKSRYYIIHGPGDHGITRIDKWTGKSWVTYGDHGWVEITEQQSPQ